MVLLVLRAGLKFLRAFKTLVLLGHVRTLTHGVGYNNIVLSALELLY